MLLFCNVKSAKQKRKPRRSDDPHLSSTWYNSTVEGKNLLEGSSIYNSSAREVGWGWQEVEKKPLEYYGKSPSSLFL